MSYVQPLCAMLLAVITFGLYRAIRHKRLALLAGGVGALWLLCWPPVDWLLSRPLEARYPVKSLPAESADAIVVLSAGVAPPVSERPYPLPDADTFERCRFAAWLYSHWRPLPILASGGSFQGGEPFSRSMRDLLLGAGVPENMIWTEEHSRTTHENATFSAALLRMHKVQRIALVVEARSMPRAAACFRKEGFTVVPAPSGFREFGPIADEILPTWKAIARNEVTLHETAGLAWYWLRGWI